jgi:hypothetical protein
VEHLALMHTLASVSFSGDQITASFSIMAWAIIILLAIVISKRG